MAKNYKSYRGRGGHSLIKGILVSILILFLAFIAFFFLLQPFIRYTPDGVTVDVPWVSQSPSTAPSVPPSPTDPVTSSPSASPGISPEPSVTPAPTPSPTPSTAPRRESMIYAVLAPSSALGDPNALRFYADLVKDTRVNTLVFEMKPKSGELAWPSNLEAAIQSGSVTNAADVGSAVAYLRENGVTYIYAHISALRDNIVPRRLQDSAVKHNKGVIWLDSANTPWLNPNSPVTQAYLTGMVSELADMGFDEIILDNLQLPSSGKLSLIKYDSGAMDEALSSLLSEMKKAANGKISLSAVLSDDALINGYDPVTAQRISSLLPSLDRIYYSVSAPSASKYDSVINSIRANYNGLLPASFVPIITDVSKNANTIKSAIDSISAANDLGWYLQGSVYPPEALS